MKEEKKSFISEAGAFLKILQDHKWNAKRRVGGLRAERRTERSKQGESKRVAYACSPARYGNPSLV